MNHRSVSSLCFASATLLFVSPAPLLGVQGGAPGGRPNILFLFADDQRADTIAAWGNPRIKTPNLDRLVHTGFSFRGNYIFGGNSGAVCMPSRAMLMSGKTWFHVDTRTLKGAKLLPELLQENGYATFGTGTPARCWVEPRGKAPDPNSGPIAKSSSSSRSGHR